MHIKVGTVFSLFFLKNVVPFTLFSFPLFPYTLAPKGQGEKTKKKIEEHARKFGRGNSWKQPLRGGRGKMSARERNAITRERRRGRKGGKPG